MDKSTWNNNQTPARKLESSWVTENCFVAHLYRTKYCTQYRTQYHGENRMTNDNFEAIEADLEEGITLYIDQLLQKVQSPVKRAYAKRLLLADFNNTLPRGIYMDNEVYLDGEGIPDSVA